MERRIVTVFGGSGFLGRHVVKRLAADGWNVRVAVRDTESAIYLKPLGDVGQILPLAVDIRNDEAVAAAVAGADAVINLVGILFERRRGDFRKIHAEGAERIAKAAAAAGVAKLVHVSAIGADAASDSQYAKTKAEGEATVLQAFPKATILRPSVVFGAEDNFFNMFANLARISPVLPVFGCPFPPRVSFFKGDSLIDVDLYGEGGTRFQPVWVGDVAEAARKALTDPKAEGRIYELGGPGIYSFVDLMRLVLRETGRKAFLAPLPFAIANFEAFFLEMLPNPLLTRDQVKLLKRDNMVGGDALTLADLGIDATPAESVLPSYLFRYRPQALQATREA